MTTLTRKATRSSTLTHRRASWLGVFAMLMMFIGPLVSQSLPTPGGTSRGMAHDMPMGMAMDMPMSMQMPATAHSGEHDHSLHPLWEKCGYCSLFFHNPALPQALLFIAAAQPLHSLGSPPQALAGHARQAIFPGARTRAPPVSLPA
ncbi:DUF2946 domain-containing protein [Pseudomonas sp. HR96]|uniref:DUF2946 domain-containing protein n=1 Tax=Pseudomonas sp. HR96 TaxID=1027966 RepID=UPI002A76250E|nr:DUF2946 domain-containing protein [Pseudomonas sp. HR96]WPP00473.1 DUF2946 domain-containing protein [Pseudomonas sp. HR96]